MVRPPPPPPDWSRMLNPELSTGAIEVGESHDDPGNLPDGLPGWDLLLNRAPRQSEVPGSREGDIPLIEDDVPSIKQPEQS